MKKEKEKKMNKHICSKHGESDVPVNFGLHGLLLLYLCRFTSLSNKSSSSSSSLLLLAPAIITKNNKINMRSDLQKNCFVDLWMYFWDFLCCGGTTIIFHHKHHEAISSQS
jgi:hypothetical protein